MIAHSHFALNHLQRLLTLSHINKRVIQAVYMKFMSFLKPAAVAAAPSFLVWDQSVGVDEVSVSADVSGRGQILDMS